MNIFRSLSLTHKIASLEIRELVSFNESEATSFLLKIKDVFDIQELLLISTCNRTELYYMSLKDISKEIIKMIATIKDIPDSLDKYFVFYNETAAIEHLFRVSLGLESQVLGDIQISNQIKRSYQVSTDLNFAGAYLHRLLHTIFYTHKKVIQETRLQDGNASIASIATNMVKTFAAKIQNPNIALIGLGEIGQNVLDNLSEMKESNITIVSRDTSNAIKIAKQFNAEIGVFSDIEKIFVHNDVIISATSAKDLFIKSDELSRNINHKLLLDLSVPRSIHQNMEKIPGVLLYNLDQLKIETDETRHIRKQALPDVERIVKESLTGFVEWKNEMEVSPIIHQLKHTLEEIRKEELSKYLHKASDSEKLLLDTVTKSMIQKVIKLPVLQLKAACKRGEAATLVDILNDLFNLETKSAKKSIEIF